MKILNSKFTIIATIILVLVAMPTFMQYTANYTTQEQEIDLSKNDVFQKEKNELLAKYDAKNKNLIADAKSKIDVELNAYLRDGNAGIDKLLAKLSLFNELTKLCYLQACDKIKGTNKADVFIAEYFNRYVGTVIINAHKTCDNILMQLEDELKRNNTELQIELGELAKKHNGKCPRIDLEKINASTKNFIVQSKKLSLNFGVTATSVALETIYIKTTISAVKKLTAKVVAKMGVSAAVAVADGPLPIGDIIAVFGAGWLAWDIYDLTYALPKKIKGDLKKNLKDDHASLLNYTKIYFEVLEENSKIEFKKN